MIDGKIYQEVYELLCQLNPIDIEKIPKRILEKIDSKRDKDYITNIDYTDVYNEDNISAEALKIYMSIDYEYVMSEEEKEYINNE